MKIVARNTKRPIKGLLNSKTYTNAQAANILNQLENPSGSLLRLKPLAEIIRDTPELRVEVTEISQRLCFFSTPTELYIPICGHLVESHDAPKPSEESTEVFYRRIYLQGSVICGDNVREHIRTISGSVRILSIQGPYACWWDNYPNIKKILSMQDKEQIAGLANRLFLSTVIGRRAISEKVKSVPREILELRNAQVVANYLGCSINTLGPGLKNTGTSLLELIPVAPTWRDLVA